MKEPFLSIIVAVYNTESYLQDCLDSFYVHNLSENKYEIICVDDGSTDRSAEILDEYALQHKNMRVFHQKNAGVSAAKNIGLDYADGEYVWFVDSDDFIAAGILDDIAACLQKGDCDQLAIFPFQFIDGEPITCFSNVSADDYSKKSQNYLFTRVLRNQCIQQIGLRFNIKITYQEDNVFYTSLFPHLQNKKLLYDRIGYFYRIRQGSLSHGGTADNRIISSFIAGAENMKKLYEINGMNYNGYAYNLYMFMTKVMQMIAAEPQSYKDYYVQAKQKRLFPLKYNREYSAINSKQNDSFIKTIKKHIYSLSYTRVGYHFLRLLYKIHVFNSITRNEYE